MITNSFCAIEMEKNGRDMVTKKEKKDQNESDRDKERIERERGIDIV